jgi:hypothetical protein
MNENLADLPQDRTSTLGAYFCRKDWSKEATIGPIR